jgi:hypothetical protein
MTAMQARCGLRAAGVRYADSWRVGDRGSPVFLDEKILGRLKLNQLKSPPVLPMDASAVKSDPAEVHATCPFKKML